MTSQVHDIASGATLGIRTPDLRFTKPDRSASISDASVDHKPAVGLIKIERPRRGHERHGATAAGRKNGSSEYAAWVMMRQRCLNPKARKFPDYGGRGIRICDRWLASFAAFLADMGPKPSPAHSIDRRDNDGHYEPLGKGSVSYVSVDIEPRYAVVFECQHGRFVVESNQDKARRLYTGLHLSDRVTVRYREVFSTEKGGARHLKGYDFIDAVKTEAQ